MFENLVFVWMFVLCVCCYLFVFKFVKTPTNVAIKFEICNSLKEKRLKL